MPEFDDDDEEGKPVAMGRNERTGAAFFMFRRTFPMTGADLQPRAMEIYDWVEANLGSHDIEEKKTAMVIRFHNAEDEVLMKLFWHDDMDC